MSEPTAHHHDDEDTGAYRGPADVTVGAAHATVDIQLSGHFDPILGRHGWRGRLRGLTAALPAGTPLGSGTDVTITVTTDDGELTATARITEVDLWGSHMVDGTSTPPYRTISDDASDD